MFYIGRYCKGAFRERHIMRTIKPEIKSINGCTQTIKRILSVLT